MLACNLTNVGHKARTVQVRIIGDGAVLLDSGEVTVAPQHTANYYVDGVPNGAPMYCEFTVEGSKNDYRGAVKLFHYPNSTTCGPRRGVRGEGRDQNHGGVIKSRPYRSFPVHGGEPGFRRVVNGASREWEVAAASGI